MADAECVISYIETVKVGMEDRKQNDAYLWAYRKNG
jgi:hypothetical protein